MFTPAEAAEIVAAAGEKRLGELVAPPPDLSFEQVVDLGGEFGLSRAEVAAARDRLDAARERLQAGRRKHRRKRQGGKRVRNGPVAGMFGFMALLAAVCGIVGIGTPEAPAVLGWTIPIFLIYGSATAAMLIGYRDDTKSPPIVPRSKGTLSHGIRPPPRAL